jgi:hypothetical protein
VYFFHWNFLIFLPWIQQSLNPDPQSWPQPTGKSPWSHIQTFYQWSRSRVKMLWPQNTDKNKNDWTPNTQTSHPATKILSYIYDTALILYRYSIVYIYIHSIQINFRLDYNICKYVRSAVCYRSVYQDKRCIIRMLYHLLLSCTMFDR